MDNIQEDGKAEAMSGVDELLEVLWGSVARTRSEEVGDLIAEC